MTKKLSGFVLLAYFLGTVFALCEENPDLPEMGRRSRWQGLPRGTWMIVSVKMYQDGKLVRSSSEKFVQVSEPNDDRVVHDVYPETDGAFPETKKGQARYFKDTLPSIHPDFELKQQHHAKLEIDGIKYPCEVKEYTYSNPKTQRSNSVIYWYAKEPLVPYRKLPLDGPDLAVPSEVLRVQILRKEPGKQSSQDLRVASFEVKKKVGEQEFVCVQEKAVGKITQGDKTITFQTERWLSSKVPGHEVEWISTGMLNGVEHKRVEAIEKFHLPESQP